MKRFWDKLDHSPDAVALVDGSGAAISRSELARLAHEFDRNHTTRAARRLTVLGEQSLRMAAVISAARIAGREFAVVGTGEPPEVRRSQVAALCPDVIVDLTNGAGLPAVDVPVVSGAQLVAAASAATGAATRVPVEPAPHAYTVHTSGSTGRPKLVQMGSRAFDHYVEQFVDRYDLGTGTRLAVWAAPTYDAHHCQLFSALASGGVGVVAGLDVRRSGASVLEWLRTTGVTHFETTPSILRELVAAAQQTGLPSGLRHIVCSGERFEPALARAVAALAGPLGERIRLSNEFGPTECVLATWHEITPADLDLPDLPVGTPIPGRQIEVRPVRGSDIATRTEPGEVVIRSRHLCAGYGLAGALVESFPVDRGGVRTYHTGDLGYVDERGLLRLAGRRDRTVKRRGVKVVLDDVERAVEAVSYVVAAAALAERGGSAVRVWAVSRDPDRTEDDLRADVAEHLAAASMPEHVTLVDDLPRLHSGKIDYRALSGLRSMRPMPSPDHTDATATETVVMREFARVLGVPVASRDADFFALGGHSLLALDLNQGLVRRFGVAVTLADVLRYPKARVLAELVDSRRETDVPADAVPSGQEGLTAAERPIWTWSQLFPGDGAANVVAGFRTTAPVTDEEIASSVTRLVSQIPRLRFNFPVEDGRPVRVVRPPRPVEVRTVIVDGAVGDCAWPEASRAFYRPFDIASDLLVRVVVVRSSTAAEFAVCVVVHHIVCDGIGLAGLLDEVRLLVTGGSRPHMPSTLIASGARTADAGQAVRHWNGIKDTLRTLPYLAEPGTPGQTQTVPVASFTVPAAHVDALAEAENLRLAAILVEFVAEALMRATDATTVVVETPVSLRAAGEARAIGNFVVDVPVIVGGTPGTDRTDRRAAVAADLLDAVEAAPAAPGFGGLRPGQSLAPVGDAVVVLEHRDEIGDARSAPPVRIAGSPPRNPVAVYVTAAGDTLEFRVLSRIDPGFAGLVSTHLHTVAGESARTPARQEHM